MSKTILANVDGFTPVIDHIAKDYGVIHAAVFGRIWRYCQMPDGVCRASLETIAEDLGIQLPFEIETIHIIKSDNMKALEAELHHRFAMKRVRGEWFNLSEEDVNVIKEIE